MIEYYAMSAVNLVSRPRRNRRSTSHRELVQETSLESRNLIWPVFVQDGQSQKTEISSLPGCYRFSPDLLVQEAREAYALGIPAIALFPVIEEALKDKVASESKNPKGLLIKTVRAIKQNVPELLVITDVAMDPYSSDGHDGLVENGEILNDETLPILAEMAVAQAKAGADMVAPSDMMDGRVGFIRKALDEAGFTKVGILAYAAKYASAFYGPFREALDSAPRSGDKRTYQMNPTNRREALREIELDVAEGADIVMIKPALPYLDVIKAIKERITIPVAAYHVSGEYAMIKAAAEKGWLDESLAMREVLVSIKRAGADMIFTYFAKAAAEAIAAGKFNR